MRLYYLTFFSILIFSTPAFPAKNLAQELKAPKPKKVKDPKIVTSYAGLNIPNWGLAIDVQFDPRLDSVLPGHHIINLVLTNKRNEAILLDVQKDKWVFVDQNDKKHVAFNHVTQFDTAMWQKLPRKLKELLEYPSQLSPGKSVNVDVFLPVAVELANFKSVIFKSKGLNKTFDVLTAYEDQLSFEQDKEFDTPRTNTFISEGHQPLPANAPTRTVTIEELQQADALPPPAPQPQVFTDPSLDEVIVLE